MVTITPRSAAATGLAVVMVLAIGLSIALPAKRAYDAKLEAQARGQELASQVLTVCQQGGDIAAPLVAIKACPLAQQIQSASQAVAAPVNNNSLTPAQIQALVQREVARQMAKPAPASGVLPTPTPEAAPPGPAFAPPAAGRQGKERAIEAEPRPTPRDPEPPTPTAREAPFRYPAERREPQRQVTVTEQAPEPAPVTQTVEQPQPPVEQQPGGTPLLNGLGGLLNGLGSGL